MNKVLIVDGGKAYHTMFKEAGFHVVYQEEVADFLCFTGGADVHPSYYGESLHPYSSCDISRDIVESSMFRRNTGKPMVGICRGGQFLNVMCGGAMYQDVNHHAVYAGHELIDLETYEQVHVTSTHHQMMIPGENADIIAVAFEATYAELMHDCGIHHIEVNSDEHHEDIEVLTYPGDILCFQPHPEFHGADSTREYFFALLKRELGLQGANVSDLP
jgi:gamma-glutamyl-gamma-aminobutyrate hydrolase PuuD